jgi:hypothetical protein
MSEQNQDIKDALLPLLEQAASGDVSASVAISLKRIADRLDAEPAKTPPKVIHR